jgi:hypothetical protein
MTSAATLASASGVVLRQQQQQQQQHWEFTAVSTSPTVSLASNCIGRAKWLPADCYALFMASLKTCQSGVGVCAVSMHQCVVTQFAMTIPCGSFTALLSQHVAAVQLLLAVTAKVTSPSALGAGPMIDDWFVPCR